MLGDKRVLAVVPARAGSKGVPNKNMRVVGGMTLIARAGEVLRAVSAVDQRIISTDSAEYAAEGRAHGLDAPFLRPAALSADTAGAVETMQHSLTESEKTYQTRFDVVLIIEPTSPMRTAADIDAALALLQKTGADSVVSVSPVETRFHPRKLLREQDGRLELYAKEGERVVNRQEIRDRFYWRNGLCYALTRDCLMSKGAIFSAHTVPYVVERPVVNIDDPLDIDFAEFLLARRGGAAGGPV